MMQPEMNPEIGMHPGLERKKKNMAKRLR